MSVSNALELILLGIPAYTLDPFTIPPSALPYRESFHSVHFDPDTLEEALCVRLTATAQVGISLSLFSEPGYRALVVLAQTSTTPNHPHRRRVVSSTADRGPPATNRRPHSAIQPRHATRVGTDTEAFADFFVASGVSCYELDNEAAIAEQWTLWFVGNEDKW